MIIWYTYMSPNAVLYRPAIQIFVGNQIKPVTIIVNILLESQSFHILSTVAVTFSLTIQPDM